VLVEQVHQFLLLGHQLLMAALAEADMVEMVECLEVLEVLEVQVAVETEVLMALQEAMEQQTEAVEAAVLEGILKQMVQEDLELLFLSILTLKQLQLGLA
jgi:hypothetical protein